MNQPILTIILPTYNEASNVCPLLFEIRKSLSPDLDYEILFVDDSDDGTPEIIRTEMSKADKIRLIHRQPKDRTGLATAFVIGFEEARGEYICCMDSDLQHPPKTINALLRKIIATSDDIVVASRYIEGGNADGLGCTYRKSVSVVSKYVAYLIIEATRRSSDPGSGYFIFRKTILGGVSLSPRGFKILIEILVKTNTERVSEVPVLFLARENDESKASIKQGLEFLKHLWYLFRTVPYAGRFIKFCFVGFIGTIVNLGILYILVEYGGINQYVSWLVAVLFSILCNFMLNDRITYSDRSALVFITYVTQLCTFCLLSLCTVAINFVVYRAALSLGVPYLLSAVYGIFASTLINYIIASSAVWTSSVAGNETLSIEGGLLSEDKIL